MNILKVVEGAFAYLLEYWGVVMRKRKRKVRGPWRPERNHGICREEIGGDVFELWLGISRLMARIHGSTLPAETSANSVRRTVRDAAPTPT